MNPFIRQQLYNGKRRIEHRLRPIQWAAQKWPMLSASNIHYDVAGRTRMYEKIFKGEYDLEAGLPESFNVLVRELKSLALNVELLKKDKDQS